MKKITIEDYRQDKRHLICSGITLLSFLMILLFPNSLPRLAEALRDLGTSLVFYVLELSGPEQNPIPDTINKMPEWKLLGELWKPIKIIPASWEEFTQFWSNYISLLFSSVNLRFYWYAMAAFRQREPSSRSRIRTPDSRV